MASPPACSLWTIQMIHPNLVLMTGERQVGKSTACRRAIALMRRAGLEVSGLLTTRAGPHDLAVHELHTGLTYPLTLPFEKGKEQPLMNFRMDPDAMARSGGALAQGFPTDVIVIDELGPLELKRGQGWVEALGYLHDEEYDVGILVIRPELLWVGMQRLTRSVYTVVSVTLENRDRIPATLAETARAAVARKRAGEEETL